jgi:hypothetical protein
VFKTSAGAAPEFTPPTVAKNISAMVLTALGGKGRFYSSAPVKISLDGGQTFKEAGPQGVEIEGVQPGIKELTIETKGKQRKETVTIDAGPSLTAFFYSSRPPVARGILSISAPEGGFEVLVDNKPVKYVQRGGDYQVMSLDAGKRQVRIQKSGFRADPEVQSVEIKENQVTKVSVRFATAAMRVVFRGGAPGIQIVLASAAGRVLGATDGQGNFTAADLPAGNHTFELRRKGYRAKRLEAILRPGSELTVSAQQLGMERKEGVLSITTDPRTTALKIDQTQGDLRYDGPNPLAPVPGTVALPAGFYNLVFSAPGYADETVNIDLADGRKLTMPVKLRKK